MLDPVRAAGLDDAVGAAPPRRTVEAASAVSSANVLARVLARVSPAFAALRRRSSAGPRFGTVAAAAAAGEPE